jgi:hypothetical protein
LATSVKHINNSETSKKAIFISILRALSERIVALHEKNPELVIKIKVYKARLSEPPIFDQQLQESEELTLSGVFEEAIDLFEQKEQ